MYQTRPRWQVDYDAEFEPIMSCVIDMAVQYCDAEGVKAIDPWCSTLEVRRDVGFCVPGLVVSTPVLCDCRLVSLATPDTHVAAAPCRNNPLRFCVSLASSRNSRGTSAGLQAVRLFQRAARYAATALLQSLLRCVARFSTTAESGVGTKLCSLWTGLTGIVCLANG